MERISFLNIHFLGIISFVLIARGLHAIYPTACTEGGDFRYSLNMKPIIISNEKIEIMDEKPEELDRLGYNLLKNRISKCPEIIQNMLEAPVREQLTELPKHFLVTGIGSSEAHGRFFTNLINRYTDSNATFVNLSNFYTELPKTAKERDSTLVVFSQGLSPNSLLAINQRAVFGHLILFTSTTASNSKETHSELIKKLKAEGHKIVQFPLENEYTLLIRVIGPIAGYLAAIQFVEQNWPGSINSCDKKALVSAIKNACKNVPKEASNLLKNMKKGSVMIMSAPLCEYAQNLAYKFLEGLFIPKPRIIDYLSFSHGFFQQLVTDPVPVVIFKENTIESQLLYCRAKQMIEATQSKIIEITSNLPPPWNILEYEAILNELILDGIKEWEIDQIAWPGKGLDQSLYNIRDPQS